MRNKSVAAIFATNAVSGLAIGIGLASPALAASAIILNCPPPAGLVSARVGVAVNENSDGNYIYTYTVTPTSSNETRPSLFTVSGEFDRIVSNSGWSSSPCTFFSKQKEVTCGPQRGSKQSTLHLQLASKVKPGIVFYSMSNHGGENLFSKKSLDALLPRYHQKQGALYEDIQESMPDQCSSGSGIAAFTPFNDVIVGPSGREVTDRLVIDNAGTSTAVPVSLTSEVKRREIQLRDIESSSMVVKTFEKTILPIGDLSMKSDSEGLVHLTFSGLTDLPCGARAVVVDGIRYDGVPFRAAFHNNAPACSSETKTFTLNPP